MMFETDGAKVVRYWAGQLPQADCKNDCAP